VSFSGNAVRPRQRVHFRKGTFPRVRFRGGATRSAAWLQVSGDVTVQRYFIADRRRQEVPSAATRRMATPYDA
jgi:hypothetical protein